MGRRQPSGGGGASSILRPGPHAEPDHHRRDQHDGAGVDDRSRLTRENFEERGTWRRLEIAARIDEIDHGNLDDVAALPIEPGGRGDELLDLLDLTAIASGAGLSPREAASAARLISTATERFWTTKPALVV